jgi:hypothetical protein
MTTIDTVTAAPETTIAPVTVAIDDGPVTPDADGRSRGWRATVIVSPTERRASLFTAIGSGVPADVWHNRVLSLAVNTAASGEAVRAILEDDAAQAILADLCDQYEGDRWDGHNHVGRWPCDEDGTPDYLSLIMRLEAMIAEAPCYQSAADWCSPAWSECKREVEAAILGAKDADAEEAALAALVDKWATDARDNGALIDAADLREQVDAMADESGDADVYVVDIIDGTPRCDTLDTVDLDADVEDMANLGETWALVEAASEVDAWRKARALFAQSGVVAEARRLAGEWTYPGDALDRIAAALPA